MLSRVAKPHVIPLTPRATPRQWAVRAALAAILLALAGLQAAHGHAQLDSSIPAANATVTEEVTSIVLDFSEGVEVAFSSFKVYTIVGEVDQAADDAGMLLNALASDMAAQYNGSQEEGDGFVPTTAAAPDGDGSKVLLQLVEPLGPGHYVVMWKALSADTHAIDGHFVFTVIAPQAP